MTQRTRGSALKAPTGRGNDGPAPANPPPLTVRWDNSRTNRLVSWLTNNVADHLRLFSDSSRDATAEGCNRITGKVPKAGIHKKMATDIFRHNSDDNLRLAVLSGAHMDYYGRAVDNQITWLKKKYHEITKELGATGAGLTVDEIHSRPDYRNIMGEYSLFYRYI